MAPRTLDRLTNIVVTRTKAPGWYADGGGLYLRIRDDGSRRWFFVYFLAGKRTEMGLGNAADLSLSDARLERTKWRKAVKDGKNPLAERRRERAEAAAGDAPTFGAWAKEIAPAVAPRAPKAHAAWLRMMTEWVGPLKAKPVNEVRTEDVLAALKPYWKSRPESGRRMRLRIEAVLDAAKAKGLIADPWANPARWKGHLQHLLEKPAVAVRHHPALPYADAPISWRTCASGRTWAPTRWPSPS
jgi:hypothetical protein